MALVVNSNIPSIASQRHLMESRKEMETAMERLSSGKRINSAADDAAGLAISTRMDSQVRGINAAIKRPKYDSMPFSCAARTRLNRGGQIKQYQIGA